MTLISKFSHYNKVANGEKGFRVFKGTDVSIDGEVFGALVALADAELYVDSVLPAGDATSGLIPLPGGVPIFGSLTNINMVSGTVIGYLKN